MEQFVSIEKDLLELDPRDFYVKHILKTPNWYFSKYLCISDDEIIDKLDTFKEIVSTNLGVSFYGVQIVGSAKVGYSLAPDKVLKPFNDGIPGKDSSDIDVAVVSERLYNHFWDALRSLREVYYETYYYTKISRSIYKGYIDEKSLIHFDKIKPEWNSMIVPTNILLQDKLSFVHPITYRIYRSWEDLEDYQIYSISQANTFLQRGSDV